MMNLYKERKQTFTEKNAYYEVTYNFGGENAYCHA